MTNFVVDTKFITTLSDCAASVTVSLRSIDDPDVCCIWTRAGGIASLVNLGDLEVLKEISYHI